MKRLLIALLVLAANAAAQTFSLSAGAGIGYTGNAGLKNPYAVFRVSPELSTMRWLVLGDLHFSPTGKVVGGGWGFSLRPEVYHRISRNWLVGGGLAVGCDVTSQYTKCSERPLLGVAYDTTGIRERIRYVVPTEHRNHLQGFLFNADLPLRKVKNRRLSFFYELGVYHFHVTDIPAQKYWGTGLTAGLKLELYRREK